MDGSGEKLRDLLREHGDFKQLEVQLKKTHLSKLTKARQGGWYTRAYLLSQCHWTKLCPEVFVIGAQHVLTNLVIHGLRHVCAQGYG